MRLELGKFPVTEVEFGDKTAWTDGKLEIDRAGLTSKILEDPASCRRISIWPGRVIRFASR